MRPSGQGDGRVVLPELYPKMPQGEGQEGNGPPAPHPPGLLRPHLSTGGGGADKRQWGIKCGFS